MTNLSEAVELKPCPFCGSEAWLVKHSSLYTDEYSVRCYQGCCEIGEEYEEDAVKVWNTRAAINTIGKE
jgi:Lar family restriction alleviation protein